MIAARGENRFFVNVSADNGSARRAKIHSRGSASKEFGFASPAKRLPIELRFDEASDYSDLFSNTCIKFSNAFVPYRLVAEYLAYEMYAFLDIPTPVHSFAFMQYNDVDFGLYLALEDVNETFLEKHFSPPFGSLYKGAENTDAYSYSSSRFFGGLVVRADHGSERIDALLHAMNYKSGYEAYLDMDEVLRFWRVRLRSAGSIRS